MSSGAFLQLIIIHTEFQICLGLYWNLSTSCQADKQGGQEITEGTLIFKKPTDENIRK